jgi:hypothetical protein
LSFSGVFACASGKWDLKIGQDKYAFTEKMVNDLEITRVFIVIDKTYAEKANNRIGGFGRVPRFSWTAVKLE